MFFFNFIFFYTLEIFSLTLPIPAYFVNLAGQENLKNDRMADNNFWVSARTIEKAQAKAQAKFPGQKFTLEQDDDVLDTWFSSALFPFSIFGWPNTDNNPDFQQFFPGSLLETGHDILFFWVARMVMFSLELTDQIPFTDVYLHAMVRDAHGRKMSKSVGNVIDPVWVINGQSLEYMQNELKSGNIDYKDLDKALKGQQMDYPNGIPECGADAMRFALCAYTSQARDINLDVLRVVGYRNFCNKMWNATKFALNLLDGFQPDDQTLQQRANLISTDSKDYNDLMAINKWILSKLAKATEKVDAGMKVYDFPQVTTACHAFWLYDLCDVYLEAIKPIVYSKDGSFTNEQIHQTKLILNLCLDQGLRLLAPIMPYITEELWQRLPRYSNDKDSIHIMNYPRPSDFYGSDSAVTNLQNYNNIDVNFDYTYDTVKAIRSLRADYNLTPKMQPSLYIKTNIENQKTLEQFKYMISSLCNSNDIQYVDNNNQFPVGCGVGIVNDNTEIGIMLKGIIDVDKEVQKLGKELAKVEKNVQSLAAKMQKENYIKKVSEDVKEKDTQKLESAKKEAEKLKAAIANFESMK